MAVLHGINRIAQNIHRKKILRFSGKLCHETFVVACDEYKNDACDGDIIGIKFLQGMKTCKICKTFLPQKFHVIRYVTHTSTPRHIH